MNNDDLIKRGDALKAMHSHDWQKTYDAIAAIPAVTAPQGVDMLMQAVSLTVKADNLREAYHALPNDKNRIGDKKSRKSQAREAWLRAFRKAAATSRAALAPAQPALTSNSVDGSQKPDPAINVWNAALDAAAKALLPKRLKAEVREYQKGYNDGLGDALDALSHLKGGGA